MLALKLLFLIGLANGAPILAENLLKGNWSTPIDGGRRFVDGRPLLGPSKTWRGLVAAVLAAGIVSTAFGLDLGTGALLGLGSMMGDLLSSFVKRRMGIEPSGMALGLDQIPEAALPLWMVKESLDLAFQDIITVTLWFIVIELLLSQVLFRLHIRKRPY